jgi:hypothetical protein
MLLVANIGDIVLILASVAVFALTEIVWFTTALIVNSPQVGNQEHPSAKK